MHIWLIKDGENLPVQHNSRKMRTGILAEELVNRGHDVIWWTSTFSHQRKSLLYKKDTDISVKPRFLLRLINAGIYKKNFSLKRYVHHRILAKKIRKHFRANFPPDVIICAFPIIDVAYEAVLYARKKNIPIILDIRDLWPDIILENFSSPFQNIVRFLLQRDFKRTKEAIKKADSLVAISRGCLEWSLKYAERPSGKYDKVFYTGYPSNPPNSNYSSSKIEKFRRDIQAKKVFTFVGSFGISYELQLLCDAAQKIIEEGDDNIHFAIAGDGQQRRALAARSKSLSNLSLLGWLNEHEITQLLKLSYAGIVPCKSVVDAMPNKTYEYFSSGLPVLSSLEGEMAQIIEMFQVGYSYKCGDVQGLSDCVMRLSQDEKLRNQMGSNALKLFGDKFSAEIVYSQFCEHIENVAKLKIQKS